MKKRSERGFGVVEVILVIIIVALIGALGWLFWERSNSASTETSDTSKTEEQKPSKNDTKEEVKTTTVSNQYFSFYYQHFVSYNLPHYLFLLLLI
jgi:flagellar basal body-associated protein FliL